MDQHQGQEALWPSPSSEAAPPSCQSRGTKLIYSLYQEHQLLRHNRLACFVKSPKPFTCSTTTQNIISDFESRKTNEELVYEYGTVILQHLHRQRARQTVRGAEASR